jgi:hypothetical protein
MKPPSPVLQSTHLLYLLRERFRYRHYSLIIVKHYVFAVYYFCIVQRMWQAQCAI